MLHSALPRAYLAGAPGMSYLGGYLEEIHQHPYAYVPQHLDEAYGRLAWDTSVLVEHHPPRRASTPCPLDLSLKPPPTPSTPSARTEECEAIEVDDEEDRRSREEARSLHHSPYARELLQENVVVDDEDSQRSCSSAHSLYQPKKIEPVLLAALTHQEAYPSYQHLLQTPPHRPHHHHQQQQHFQGIHAPITPPSTPSPPQCPGKRKAREEDAASSSSGSSAAHTPSPPKPAADKPPRSKKKHARRLKFDEDTSSPVSGTVILGPDEAVVTGDIDPAFNIVEVTEEARAELAKIENRLGPYQCKLCRQLHDDAFQLAQHRCSRIAHVEYRCPECDKRFSCPANLASHRRWHKPRPAPAAAAAASTAATGEELACTRCDAKFSRQAALRKHVAAQHSAPEQNNNNQDEMCKQQQQQQLGNAAAAMEMA